MTLLIVRLRLAMWRTAMSRSALQLTSSILGGLAALLVVVVLGPALVLLVGQPVRITALVVPLFAGATLMWAVLSLIATGWTRSSTPRGSRCCRCAPPSWRAGCSPPR